MKKKYKVTEILNEDGKSIGNITAIALYKEGIVVGTDKGLYTNVKSLLTSKKNI